MLFHLFNLQIIENKKTDAVSNKKKEEYWVLIENEYNSSCTGPQKTVKQLQVLYKNYKAALRRSLAQEKHNTFMTGGGKPATSPVDESDPFLPLVQNSVTPLENIYDSSTTFFGDTVSKVDIIR